MLRETEIQVWKDRIDQTIEDYLNDWLYLREIAKINQLDAVAPEKVERIIRMELAKFAICIAVGRGAITWNMKNAINDIIGTTFSTPEEMMAANLDITSQLPFMMLTLIMFASSFNLYDNEKADDLIDEWGEKAICLYKEWGAFIATFEGAATENQIAFYVSYMEWIEEELA